MPTLPARDWDVEARSAEPECRRGYRATRGSWLAAGGCRSLQWLALIALIAADRRKAVAIGWRSVVWRAAIACFRRGSAEPGGVRSATRQIIRASRSSRGEPAGWVNAVRCGAWLVRRRVGNTGVCPCLPNQQIGFGSSIRISRGRVPRGF